MPDAANIGCTSYTWQNTDGSLHFLGRTFDAAPAELAVQFQPRSYLFHHYPATPDSSATATPYAVLGMGAPVETPLLDDGINEKGLMGSMQLFPPAAYLSLDGDAGGRTKLNPLVFIGFALGQCANLAEVSELARTVAFVDDAAQGLIAPVHFHFTDRSGASLIVEPQADGTVALHETTMGVMTNAPEYPWHLTNLRNYLGLCPQAKPDVEINGVTLARFGSGTGFSGVPGDYSSPSRFVRMAYTRQFLVKGTDEADCVARMFNGFSTVTVPEGVDLANFAGGTNADGSPICDISLYTSVMCSESLTYYYRTHVAPNVRALRLANLLNGTERRTFALPDSPTFEYVV